MVSDGAAQLVHSWSCLSNFLGSANDIRRILQRPFSPEEKTWKDQWLFLIYCKLIQYAGAAVCFRDLFFGQKQEYNTAPSNSCSTYMTSYKIKFSTHFSFVFSLIKRILAWKNMHKIYWWTDNTLFLHKLLGNKLSRGDYIAPHAFYHNRKYKKNLLRNF